MIAAGRVAWRATMMRRIGNQTRHKSSLAKKYDVIVVGGGHNGLTSAAYLAKAGLSVLVVEKRHVVGGAAVTEEIIPGYKFSRASYLAGLLRPKVIEELELENLVYLPRNPSSFTPTKPDDPEYGGKFLLLGSNSEENKASIAQFSVKDADRYDEYEALLARVRKIVTPLLDTPLPELGFPKSKEEARRMFGLVKQLASATDRKTMMEAYELFMAPAASLLDRYFESDILKTTLATDAVIGAQVSPYQVGSGYVLLHHVMGQVNGVEGTWAYVQGGMGAVSSSIAQAALKAGAQIETGIEVVEIATNVSGEVAGIRTSDNQVVQSKIVISGCSPYRTFVELLGNSSSAEASKALEQFKTRLQTQDQSCGAFKINLAINKLPNFSCFPNTSEHLTLGGGPQHRGTIHFENHLVEIHEAYKDASSGRPARRPVIEMTIPSSLDKTLVAPELQAKGHHCAQLFVQYAPYDVIDSEGSWNDPAFKDAFVDRVLGIVDEFAPGFKSSVIGVDALSPLDLERIFGLPRGNIFHGSLSLHQLGFARPAPGFVQHRSPLRNLYMASAGTHPGGGVMGACGRNCATIVKEDLGL